MQVFTGKDRTFLSGVGLQKLLIRIIYAYTVKKIVWTYFSHKISLRENYFYIFKPSTLKHFTFRNAFNQFKYKTD